MKVLVSGAAGFIGKHTVAGLKAACHETIGLDKREGADELVDLSLLTDNTPGLMAEVYEADAIVHLAATCSTPGSILDPITTFRDTVTTAVTMLEVARRRKVPIVVVSSVKARDGKTPYGAAKRMVETWAEEYRSAYDVPVIIVRPGTVYGRGQEGSPESGWIAWFLEAKRTNQRVVVNGDGSQSRDLLHVSDLVELFVKMVEDPRPYLHRTWDVGGGVKNVVTVEQMAQWLGLDYTLGPPRYGDADSYLGINDTPHWEPHVRWRDGITRLM